MPAPVRFPEITEHLKFLFYITGTKRSTINILAEVHSASPPGYVSPKVYKMYSSIVDVAVMKCHQRLGEISIIFTHISSKCCFQKNFVMQYIHPRHLTQSTSHSLHLRTCYRYSRFTVYAC